MASTYPNVITGWLSSLAHLFYNKALDKNDDLSRAFAFNLFRQFLALKIAIPFAFTDGIHLPINIRTAVIFLVIMVAGLPRFYTMGLWIILAFSFNEFWHSFPFSINHSYLEFGIILLMCLTKNGDEMIKFVMLSVWFFSGLHKLFDGYYLNGEFFALEAIFNNTTLGHHLNQVLNVFGSSIGVFEFTKWQIGILLTLSWLTIALEILLPLFLLSNKLRPIGIMGLFIFQSFIAYFSGEIDFAFTAFAILFLFIPRLAHITYPSLAFLFLVVQPWI